jgi:hypothetical protein
MEPSAGTHRMRGKPETVGDKRRQAEISRWHRRWLRLQRRSNEFRHLGLKPVSADIRTGLCARARIPPGKGLSRPETGRAFFGDTCRFRAVETVRSRASGGKATEGQRLFRRRQETGVVQDCVVELVRLEPATERLCKVDDRCVERVASVREPQHVLLTRPCDRCIEKAGDTDSARQPTISASLGSGGARSNLAGASGPRPRPRWRGPSAARRLLWRQPLPYHFHSGLPARLEPRCRV